jgi:hypothetical protein
VTFLSDYYQLTGEFYSWTDTVEKEKKQITPKSCMLRSAIIPGFGQFTNKQSWKIPIIYGGFAGSIYALNYASTHYQDFRDAYILRTDGDSTTIDEYDPNVISDSPKYVVDQLKSARDYYRRNIEISVLVITGIYLLNIVDAYVGAHLRDFNVSDDFNVIIDVPKFNITDRYRYISAGLTISF